MKNNSAISFDAALLLALQKDAEQEIMALPKPAELKQRYPDTEKWDLRLKNALNRRKRRAWKNIFAMAAALVMLFAGALAVNADFRKAVYTVVKNFTPVEVIVQYRAEGDTLKELPEGYGEHYIIDGYELDESQSVDLTDGFIHLYQKQSEDDPTEFYTVQCMAIVKTISANMDNEHTTYTYIEINGVDVLCGEGTTMTGSTVYSLTWDKDGIFHSLMGKVELSELIQVAENIY